MPTRTLRAAAVAAAAVALAAAPASAAEPKIQPGESIVADGAYCTLNWIYDGTGAEAGQVFAGTAAHCVTGVGQEVSLAAGSLGDPIERIGEVAFVGNADEHGRDYAFIRIDDEDLPQVDAALKGHPAIPTGVSTQATASLGDVMQFSGNGVGFHLTQPTRESRVGILNWTDGSEHEATGPVTPGDSGGPIANVTDGNKAYGIVDTVGVGINADALHVVTAGEGGANLEFVLADAASRGFSVELRTV
jgi:hypothetical protein